MEVIRSETVKTCKDRGELSAAYYGARAEGAVGIAVDDAVCDSPSHRIAELERNVRAV